MVVKRVHLKDKNIKRIYEESFHKKERLPFYICVLLSLLPNTKFKKFIIDGKQVGFIYYAVGITQVFLMFFAVDKNNRNKGYGSEIIKYIKNKYPKKCIVTAIGDIQGNDKVNVIKRKTFYLKNNFNFSDWTIRFKNMDESVLTANKDFSKIKFRIFITLYGLFTTYPKIKKINNK